MTHAQTPLRSYNAEVLRTGGFAGDAKQAEGIYQIRLTLAIRPNASGAIVINYPGWNGDIDGYNGRHATIAEFLQYRNIAAVIRTANQPHPGLDYQTSVQDDLRCIIAYATDHANEICGKSRPRLYLMGFSAGAGAIAAVASEFYQAEKVLLVSPAADAGWEAMESGIRNYWGELYITAGAEDTAIGLPVGKRLREAAAKASVKEFVIVPDCDHHFRGETNGKILSKAPLWAFAGDKTYPSPEGGAGLY